LKSYDTESRKEIASAQAGVEHTEMENEQELQDLETISSKSVVADEKNMEEEEELEPRPGWRFRPPTREQWLRWLPFWGIILLEAILRFWGLGDKPLHHDESLHAYFSLQLLHNNIENWRSCFNAYASCYRYDPLLHGPFQFHAIALVYLISGWLGAPDHGVNTFTVRIVAAVLGTVLVGLPYFLRDYIGKIGAWLASFLLAVSPSMVYFSRFAREDIYMACFTLLLVVATGRYIRERKMRWIVLGASAFALSYATSEATFLTMAVFGSFLGALLMWELGKKFPVRASVAPDASIRKYLPETGAPLLLVVYFLIFLPVAKIGLGLLESLSVYITNPKNTPTADLFVQNLKTYTVAAVPWVGIILGIYVLTILVREMSGKIPPTGRHGLAKRIDPQRQPTLDTILTMPWTHWFFALLCAWAMFLVLFTALFTNIAGGIGDGIWQGLYYWLQQQEVARGGQPWYYYLLLIPLYEQIGVVFGIVGIVRCLIRPNPFRLFLVYWFVGNLIIYSWAAEKMPWLMIFMVMPMTLLAGIGLEPAVMAAWNWIKGWLERRHTASALAVTAPAETPLLVPPTRPKVGVLAGGSAVLSVVFAALLLLPTLHNMYEVSYVHAADGPHEMMVYVQTTTDVNIVMAKINALDQKMDGGRHQIAIGVMSDAEWPFAWYLRDYTNVCYGFPTACPSMVQNTPVIITGGDNLYNAESQYGKQYLYQQYKMRTWWDEGYKPPPCIPTKANNECAGQPTWGGVGPWLWLSYGDNPPAGAKFNLDLAVRNIWDWWWYRKAIGSTDGAYLMGLFIKKGLNVEP
jgi:uncharacterized protein (TIGR03663 family)